MGENDLFNYDNKKVEVVCNTGLKVQGIAHIFTRLNDEDDIEVLLGVGIYELKPEDIEEIHEIELNPKQETSK